MQKQQGIAEVNGAKIYYEITGAGHPLVLIHGSSLDMRAWDDQLEAFQHYQVIRYDRRGFGRSSLPLKSYSHHDDLTALLAHLGIRQPILLGHSSGGGVALDLAVAHPQAVRALILYESVMGGYQFAPEFAAYLASVRTKVQEEGLPAAKEAWLEGLAWQLLDTPAALLRLTRIVAEYSGWHWTHADPVRAASPPAIGQLSRVRMPTLIIVGERTTADMHKIAEVLQEIPQARKVILPRAGHMANMEVPEAFNQAVLAYLAEL